MAQALWVSQVAEQNSGHMWFTESSLTVYPWQIHLVLHFNNKSFYFSCNCNGFNGPSEPIGAMVMAGLVAVRPKCLAVALPNAGDAVPGPVIRSSLSGCSRGMTSSTNPSDFETDFKP